MKEGGREKEERDVEDWEEAYDTVISRNRLLHNRSEDTTPHAAKFDYLNWPYN